MHTSSVAASPSKAWIVLFLDGFGGVSHLCAFTFDSDVLAIDAWAREKIQAERRIFNKNPLNKSLSQRYVVYGTDVEALRLSHF